MATATVLPETNAAPPATIVNSPNPAPAESSSSISSPESTTSSIGEKPAAAGEATPASELNPQDFSSLEDFAQALIEKKQSVRRGEQSETADSSPASSAERQDDLSPENSGRD